MLNTHRKAIPPPPAALLQDCDRALCLKTAWALAPSLHPHSYECCLFTAAILPFIFRVKLSIFKIINLDLTSLIQLSVKYLGQGDE